MVGGSDPKEKDIEINPLVMQWNLGKLEFLAIYLMNTENYAFFLVSQYLLLRFLLALLILLCL